jgi:competence protein ComEA
MIVDPEPSPRRRASGESDVIGFEWDEPGWGDPFASPATLADPAAMPPTVRAGIDAAGASRGELPHAPETPTDRPAAAPGARPGGPVLLALMRPWFDPRPGELRGVIVLLAVSLAVSLALWFDASRRPSIEVLAPPATLVEVAPGIVTGPTVAGSADGSDGWGMGSGDGVPLGPVVHVSGAVREPGVVTLPEGSRVADAVEASGGAMPDARLDRLNLARRVEDGERIHVTRVGEDAPPPDEPASRGVLPDGRIDLNAASQTELETLPGVGPARAQAIIAERDVRAFRVPGDLRRVPGIGEATFQRLAPLVAVR